MSKSTPPRGKNGWDGKLRLNEADEETNGAEQPSPPESETEDNNIVHIPGEEIEPDEGKPAPEQTVQSLAVNSNPSSDLLDGVAENETDLDLNHCRVTSIPALRLERFKSVVRLCLRQNEISQAKFPENWSSAATLIDLDLYDNAISHVKGLDELVNLNSLDLSFNNIKHIKRVDHLKQLTEIFFVQNKISKIEALDGLSNLRSLELGGNRIREIENLESLSNLEELWLGKNKITELKNLSVLPNLRLLSIQANRITSESLSHLASVPQLTELYISHNALTDVTALSACTQLQTLDISSNPITSLSGIGQLAELEELWANNCRLESFEEVERELSNKERLETVYFEGNPLQSRQPALYRNKVKLALPNIRQIDATFVKAN